MAEREDLGPAGSLHTTRERSVLIEFSTADHDGVRAGWFTVHGTIKLDIGPTGSPVEITAAEAGQLGHALLDAANELMAG
jgi:hypothetical protein